MRKRLRQHRALLRRLCSALALAGLLRASTSAAKPKLTAPQPSANFSRPLSSAAKVEHALRRLTFGARSENVTELKAIGLRTWLARELNPERVPEDPALQRRLAPLETLTMSARGVAQQYSPRRNLGLASVNPVAVVARDLNEGKILRAVYSRHQLQELLVDFWYNHFNVFLNKGADRFMVAAYERDAIRPYTYGKFYDLLLHTAESPAMLFYLDNWQSVGANADVRARNSNVA